MNSGWNRMPLRAMAALLCAMALLLVVAATLTTDAAPLRLESARPATQPLSVSPHAENLGCPLHPLQRLTWTRTLEPASLTGADLAQFGGAPLGEMYAYAYRAGAWAQIPFQVDEIDASGAYTVVNGLLDPEDELSLMAGDVGEQAQPWEWIADPASETYPRYEVHVTDPLHPGEQGWVYVYRSPTLVPQYGDYVGWDGAAKRITGGTYVVGLDPTVHAGIDSLELNGTGVDVVDRSKIRIKATCYIGPIPVPMTFDEGDLAQYFELVPNIDGGIRVGGGTTEASVWFYRSSFVAHTVIDISAFEPPPPCTEIQVDSLRESTDWLDPASSGMAPAAYYDDNTPGGVPVDGAPDAVQGLPADTWQQLSGDRGTLVSALALSLGSGTLSNYYKDDSTYDSKDTGDKRSYGDAGFLATLPDGLIQVDMASFVLDPLQPNVGATYEAYQSNPLVATAVAQAWQPPCQPGDLSFAWEPVPVYWQAPTQFAAAVGSGRPPFSYGWLFGDDGSAAAGNPVDHTFAITGTFEVALTVNNACGQASLTQWVEVSAPCEPVHLADFHWAPPEPVAGQAVTFEASAAGTPPITHAWDLGDGTFGQGPTVNHTYAEGGTYTVTLTATNECGLQLVAKETAVGDAHLIYLPAVLHNYP